MNEKRITTKHRYLTICKHKKANERTNDKRMTVNNIEFSDSFHMTFTAKEVEYELLRGRTRDIVFRHYKISLLLHLLDDVNVTVVCCFSHLRVVKIICDSLVCARVLHLIVHFGKCLMFELGKKAQKAKQKRNEKLKIKYSRQTVT